jgi:hypothetical protein
MQPDSHSDEKQMLHGLKNPNFILKQLFNDTNIFENSMSTTNTDPGPFSGGDLPSKNNLMVRNCLFNY